MRSRISLRPAFEHYRDPSTPHYCRQRIPPEYPLDPERKLLTNLVKMVAYQAESDLVHLASPYYKRIKDEGRTLIHSALATPADIELAGSELRVVLAHLSPPHRIRAIASLCQELNRCNTPPSQSPVYSSNLPSIPEKRKRRGHFREALCQEI